MKLRFEFSNEKGTTNFTSFLKQTNTFQFWIEWSTKPNEEEIFPNYQWLDNLKMIFSSIYSVVLEIIILNSRWSLCKLVKSTPFLHMFYSNICTCTSGPFISRSGKTLWNVLLFCRCVSIYWNHSILSHAGCKHLVLPRFPRIFKLYYVFSQEQPDNTRTMAISCQDRMI